MIEFANPPKSVVTPSHSNANQGADSGVGQGFDTLDALGLKYKLLSYHVPYLRQFLSAVEVRGKDVLEVGGAMPREIVIDHLGCNSWTGTESAQYDEELGAANQQTLQGLATGHQPGRYQTLLKNIEDFGDDQSNRYDCIFSIACFEHIAKFPQALAAMYRCLKPGGVLFSMYSPVWSSFQGHHLYHVKVPERFGPHWNESNLLEPWEHLLKNRVSLYQVLCQRFDRVFAEELVYHVYNSPHINRYHTEDFVQFVADSPFQVHRMFATFRAEMPAGYQAALERACPGYTQFDNQGLYLHLTKL